MNNVVLVGNLTKDPEKIEASVEMSRFTVAVPKIINGERDADFINCVAFSKVAETCNKYLHKGNKVGLTGSIQTRTYEVENKKRTATEVVIKTIEFLTPKDEVIEDKTEPEPEQKKFTLDDENLPF